MHGPPSRCCSTSTHRRVSVFPKGASSYPSAPERGSSCCGEATTTDAAGSESDELRRLVNVYVDGTDIRGHDGLDHRLAPTAQVRIVGAVAGG
jgi:hypothetical protein